ncbi:energy transducer TonB [Daejeonella lutea]|uniref:Protein TonB n=1 Tax=Daejeonella lutea TaxID=572036 RepID=A0A1T5A1K7_9SPHI|nr:energy transducer TonB [Daejeonella lutea]SKB28858.1 protein TonB [Daejeonella lutea]
MINFNENLYTTQWLDLVFQNRNKSYGAYQLRKQSNETMTKALLYACIMFSAAIILPWTYGLMSGKVPVIEIPQLPDPVEVSLTKIHEPKPLTPPATTPPAKQIPLKTIQYTNMVVAKAEEANVEPPTQLQIAQSVVSTSTTAGADATGINPVEMSTGSPAGTGSAEMPSETNIYPIDAIEKYPEFPGGQEAFIKFLRKNLRYPGMAAENGIQGKVILSFVIERNGDLSHIKVLRGIGSGCDEEAMRVLAKSPQWKPGIQNKQSVRVAYNLPINFSLSN